jgi:hypothetical protein
LDPSTPFKDSRRERQLRQDWDGVRGGARRSFVVADSFNLVKAGESSFEFFIGEKVANGVEFWLLHKIGRRGLAPTATFR